MLQRSQILVIALVASIALAGCAGWGTGSPADNATGEPNQSDELEQEQNDTNPSEDTSDTPLGSEDSSTSDADSSDSDASSPQSDDSDDSGSDSDAGTPDSSDGDADAQQEHRDLTVTVTDADGNPVEGVDVTATHDDSGEERTLTTDADGTVVFSVIDGDFSLSTGDATETVTVDGDTEATLETDSDSSGGGSGEGNEGEGDENGEDGNSSGEPEQPENPDEPENPEEPEQPERPEEPEEPEQPEEPEESEDPEESEQPEEPPEEPEEPEESEEPPEDTNTTLTVNLVDSETGESLDGTVSAHAIGYGTAFTGQTSSGTITLDMPDQSEPGGDTYEVDLDADVEGYHVEEGVTTFAIELSTGEDREVTMELVPDQESPEEPENPEEPGQPEEPEQPESNTTLTVTVVDDETGDRIGDGEELSLTLNSYGIRETATIENGVATFENLPAETDGGAPSYHVDFRTDIAGYTVSETQSDFSTEIQGGQANEHTLNLIPDPEIHDVNFSVADNATGEPIEGASIEAVGGRLPSGGEMVFGGETDANGEYSTTAAEYERYEVTVRADGYEPMSSTLPITSDTNRTFGLTPENPEPAPSPAPNETNSTNSTNTTVV